MLYYNHKEKGKPLKGGKVGTIMTMVSMDDVYDIVVGEFKSARLSSEFSYTAGTLARVAVYGEVLSRIVENTFDTPEQFTTYVNIRKEQEDRSYFATLKDDPLRQILLERAEAYETLALLVYEKERLLTSDNL